MEKINIVKKKTNGSYPERVLQFGEGNFLRAFADWMIDEANDQGVYQGSIVLCQPILQGSEMADVINGQDGMYTLVMRGIEKGEPAQREKVITSVSRCINAYKDYDQLLEVARSAELSTVISNTTEAGIVYSQGDKLTDRPPSSFPAKVCVLLYERFKTFAGDKRKGLLFLPVELIDQNGDALKKIILRYAAEWGLEPEFIEWIEKANKFCNTLVDRIVSGYPQEQIASFEDQLGYQDRLLVVSELFHLWVIEGKKEWSEILPIHKSKGNVVWTEDVTPYKMRKVRILNGGHTATALAAYLSGCDIVEDFMNHEVFREYLKCLLYQEVILTLPLPQAELESFADAVCERFANPYIKHRLLDISLNSCAKFRARCLPSLLAYEQQRGCLPELLTFSLAALIRFYQGERTAEGYIGRREDHTKYLIKDDEQVLDFFEQVWKQQDMTELAQQVLGNKAFWDGHNLCEIDGLKEKVAGYLSALQHTSVLAVIKELMKSHE